MKKTDIFVSLRDGVLRLKQYSRQLSQSLTVSLLTLALFSHAPVTGQTNCSLSCHGAQISLDENCEALVIPSMIADMSQCPGGQFAVFVYTLQGDTIPNATVNENHIGMTLIASLYDFISGNSCWSYITIQDKMKPQMDCDCQPVAGFTGTIATTDPIANISDPCWMFSGFLPVNGDHYYDTWNFTISVAGMYTFTMVGGTLPDGIAAIFDGAFNPLAVCDNLLGGDDDTGGFAGPPIINISLNMVPGNYVLVTTTYDDALTGTYSWSITGPGDLFNAGEDCYMSCNEVGPNWPAPAVIDNCDENAVPILLNEIVEPLCDDNFVKRLTRSWTAVDASGNHADTCTQVFYLERINLDSIVWPDQYTVAEDNALQCAPRNWADKNLDGIPDPDGELVSTNPYIYYPGTGVPTIDGSEIWPDFMGYCNALTTYEDFVLPQIGCVKKIMRTWTVREWHCSGEQERIYVQVLEIVDDQGPQLVCPANFSHTTNGHQCTATVWVPAPAATDACGQVSRITANVPGGFVEVTGAGFWATLPVGNNLITFTAYDQCYNSNTCSMNILIEDKTPPIPVCDEHTVVSLTLGGPHGLTKVDASVFDDGSYDACGPVTFLAYRMDSCIDFDWTTGGAGVDETPDGKIDSRDMGMHPRPKVPFACCDAGAGPIMIVLVVTDASGNSNTCMVEVQVQDKIKPIVSCPTNVTISCDFPLNVDTELNEFGVLREDQHDITTWCVDDPTNPYSNNQGHICGQDGLITDNCDVSWSVRVVDYRNNCGEGQVHRIFTVNDANGTASCTQIITVTNFDPVTGDNIIWPLDYHGQECALGTDPDDLPPGHQRPVIDEDACDLVGVTYEDVVFPIVDGACWKILRTWKVIDWCRFELYGLEEGTSYWERTQIIKVTNANGPEFVTEQPTIDLCNEVDCDGLYLELIQRATDDCTPGNLLQWSYAVDLDNDGWYEIGPINGLGDIINASGEYPLGNHRIVYTFEDRCGNRTVREQLINLESCKAPVPVCINGLSADLMPIGNGEGMVRIWAKDFDASSYHPCGRPFTLSFSSNPNDIYRDFTCEHVDQGQVYVEIWATDQLGNQTYCETYIIITDNLDACPGVGTPQGIVTGNVSTETSDNVLDVAVELGGSSLQAEHTDQTGTFAFPAMPVGGSYTVVPGKNNDFKNGVSTLDLLQIQKHLLGIQNLDSPYKLIAADANNSNSLTAVDLIELRKLILGLYSELPNNTSWRFVDKAYVFPNPANPWMQQWPENRALNPLSQGVNHVDFRAIKVGDVNNTVKANAQSITPRGSGDVLDLVIDEQAVSAGQTIEVPVYAGEARNLDGMQLTFRIDRALQWVDVKAGQCDVTTDNFGWLSDNKLTASWHNTTPVNADPAQPLFTLVFKATGNELLSQAITMGTLPTEPEAYAGGEILDLAVTFRGADDAFVFELMQNEPNPFNGATRIGYVLPASGEATLTLFDLTGRQLLTRTLSGVKGMNTTELTRDEINATGMVYYQIQFQGFTATKKMMIL